MESERKVLATKAAAGQVTRIAVLQQEQAVLDRQSECRQTTLSLDLAANRLGAIAGMPGKPLRVVTDNVAPAAILAALAPTETLVRVALHRRGEEATDIRIRLDLLRRRIEEVRERQGLQVSFSRTMLNSVTAGKHLLQVKLRQVEQEIENLEDDIRMQIAETRLRYEASREEAIAAERRVALAHEYHQAILAREAAGLETPTQLAAARTAERNAMRELVRVESASQSDLAVLVSICGLRGQPSGGQVLVAGNTSVR